jgi:hypothetical protein
MPRVKARKVGGARLGAGRPPLPPDVTRTERVMVNLSPPERAGLRALAAEQLRTEADVMRRLLLLALRRKAAHGAGGRKR